MTARERHSLSVSAIESIVANTRRPYRFIYADCDSPTWLRDELAAHADAWNIEIVRFDEPLWPQQARVRIAGLITTDYTVFIDNDVEVEAGWLDTLIECADDTGAGIVGPLYLTAGDGQPASIHMAGGRLVESLSPDGRVMNEVHVHSGKDPNLIVDELWREPCDFVEFHCMLVRTALLHAGVLDADVRCVHEHIDTSLRARRLGFATYIEPSARVTYLAHAQYTLDDLAFFRKRWLRADADASIAVFCSKWDVIDDERSFGGVLQFLALHKAQVDPIRPAMRNHGERRSMMDAHELQQTRSGLLDLARERGYTRNELVVIATAYGLAHVLTDGGYRPCGRPFINHVCGTASVLVRYGLRAETVASGLLHAAYTHCAPHADGPRAAAQSVCAVLGGRGSAIERRVRAYALRRSANASAVATLHPVTPSTLLDAEVVAMIAANELDMYMSGEIRYCERTDLIDPATLGLVARTCDALGIEGLYLSLLRAQQQIQPIAREFLTGLRVSYRIDKATRSPRPMAMRAQLE
ncbi:MAG: glycosyltransferase [Casimicrobiaceae bacterium]